MSESTIPGECCSIDDSICFNNKCEEGLGQMCTQTNHCLTMCLAALVCRHGRWRVINMPALISHSTHVARHYWHEHDFKGRSDLYRTKHVACAGCSKGGRGDSCSSISDCCPALACSLPPNAICKCGWCRRHVHHAGTSAGTFTQHLRAATQHLFDHVGF